MARIADFPADDDDVVAEEKLVLSGKCETDAIVIKSLTKVYDDGKVAVDNISLGIAPGECFGLLGINGTIETNQKNVSHISSILTISIFFRQGLGKPPP